MTGYMYKQKNLNVVRHPPPGNPLTYGLEARGMWEIYVGKKGGGCPGHRLVGEFPPTLVLGQRPPLGKVEPWISPPLDCNTVALSVGIPIWQKMSREAKAPQRHLGGVPHLGAQ